MYFHIQNVFHPTANTPQGIEMQIPVTSSHRHWSSWDIRYTYKTPAYEKNQTHKQIINTYILLRPLGYLGKGAMQGCGGTIFSVTI